MTAVCAEALQELMGLGVTGPALVAAIRRIEQAAYGDKMATLAAAVQAASAKADDDLKVRRQKDRDRKRLVRVRGIPRTSKESADKETSPTPPKESTPIPPLKGGTFPKTCDPAPLEKPKQKPVSAWAAEIWELTPHRARQRTSRAQVENALKAAVRRGQDLGAISGGLAAYYASPDATKGDGEFAKGAHRVIQTDLWQSFEPEPGRPDAAAADPWPRRLLGWATSSYWNSEWGPKPGKPGYQGPEAEGLAA